LFKKSDFRLSKMVSKNTNTQKVTSKYKTPLEFLCGYILMLGGSYIVNLLFGFGDYIKMIIYVSALYIMIVYFKMTSEKKAKVE